MKKMITLFFTVTLVCQGLMAIEPISTSSPSAMGFEFKIDLHTPRSHCTKYLGICKISFCATINFEEDLPGSGEIPCNITISNSNKLVIQLSETNIMKYDPALMKFFAGKESVTFDDTYDITEEISKGMQSGGDVIIRPGSCQLNHQNGFYILTIPL